MVTGSRIFSVATIVADSDWTPISVPSEGEGSQTYWYEVYAGEAGVELVDDTAKTEGINLATARTLGPFIPGANQLRYVTGTGSVRITVIY